MPVGGVPSRRPSKRAVEGDVYGKPRLASPAKSGWLCAKLSTLQPSTPIFGSGLKDRYYHLFPGRGFVGPAGTAIATLGQRRNQSDLHHHAWRLPLGTSTTSMYQRVAELRLRRPLFVQGAAAGFENNPAPENLARSVAYG